MAAKTAILKLVSESYFSISAIDSINEMTKRVPDGDAYRILRTLHCCHYRDMPKELLREMPMLISKALGFNEVVSEATKGSLALK